MLNFIIYEDNQKMCNIYKECIHKFLGNCLNCYKIIEIDKYDINTKARLDKIEGKKIYLLDIEVPGKSGIEFARDVRNSGDWSSPIIVITTYDHLKSEIFTGRMLMLDFISKNDNVKIKLKDAIVTAYNIVSAKKAISFKQRGEIFQILHDSILYIEKNLNDNYVTVVTKNDSITIKGSINEINDNLKQEPSFMKTHRSCIVNLNNIKSYDVTNNVIKFQNKSVNLISRDKKKELKERLCQYQVA